MVWVGYYDMGRSLPEGKKAPLIRRPIFAIADTIASCTLEDVNDSAGALTSTSDRLRWTCGLVRFPMYSSTSSLLSSESDMPSWPANKLEVDKRAASRATLAPV